MPGFLDVIPLLLLDVAIFVVLQLNKVFAKMGAESLVSVLHNAQAPIRSRVGMEIEANAE